MLKQKLGHGPPRLLAPSRFATDRLLRLQDVLERRESAARLLAEPGAAAALALLDRTITALYRDCQAAGVEDDAFALLLAFAGRPQRRLPAAA